MLALQDIDAVKRSQRYLQTIIENIPTPLLVLDASMRVRFANDTFCATFQVAREETVGQLLYLLGNEQWKVPALIELLEEVLPEHRLVQNFSITHEFPKIGRKTMLVSGRRIEDIVGQHSPLILLTIQDITERSRAEAKLRASEERLHATIDALPVAVYTTNAKGRLTHFNPASIKVVGRTPELGKDEWCVTWKLFYPDGRPMPHSECPMAIALKEERDVSPEQLIAERPDGTRIWVEVYPTRLRDADGNTTGGVNMILDVTERKQAEIVLARLAAIVECSDDAIIAKNLDGVIETWNRGAERLFGYTEDEAVGKPVTMLMPPDRAHRRTRHSGANPAWGTHRALRVSPPSQRRKIAGCLPDDLAHYRCERSGSWRIENRARHHGEQAGRGKAYV